MRPILREGCSIAGVIAAYLSSSLEAVETIAMKKHITAFHYATPRKQRLH